MMALKTEMMPWHRFLGSTTYVLGMATVCLGYFEKQTFIKGGAESVYTAPQIMANIIIIFVAILTAATFVTFVPDSNYQRDPLIESSH